jgi:microsomal dipeptidase-like Zn-dependent dipeptidase
LSTPARVGAALVDHPRNVSADLLRLLAMNGGVVMINFAPPYVSDARCRWDAERAAEETRNNKPPFGGLYIGQPGGAAARGAAASRATLDALDGAAKPRGASAQCNAPRSVPCTGRRRDLA